MKKQLSMYAVLSFLFLFSVGRIWAQPQTSVFFVAHGSSWQLYMGPSVWDDKYKNYRILIITLSAGDAGLGAGGGGSIPFYQSREKASLRSVRFIADSGSAPGTQLDSTVVVRNHSMKKHVYKNMISYFLRLPDGNQNGSGFPGNNGASLEKLRTGAISNITAVDNSTTYNSWNDLILTLRAIVNKERGGPNRFLNINKPATSGAANPGDHSDNYNSGFAAESAVQPLNNKGYTSWVGDDIGNRLPNLPIGQTLNKAALFAAYVTEMNGNGYGSDWITAWTSYLDKSYKIAGLSLHDDPQPVEKAVADAPLALKAYPNPIARGTGAINVELESKQPAVFQISLTSPTGLVQFASESKISGKQKLAIPLKSRMQPGAYTLTVINGNKKESREIIVQ